MTVMNDAKVPIGASGRFGHAIDWAMAMINDASFPLEWKCKLAIAAMRIQAAEQRQEGKKRATLRAAHEVASGNSKFAVPSSPMRLVESRESK